MSPIAPPSDVTCVVIRHHTPVCEAHVPPLDLACGVFFQHALLQKPSRRSSPSVVTWFGYCLATVWLFQQLFGIVLMTIKFASSFVVTFTNVQLIRCEKLARTTNYNTWAVVVQLWFQG